mgnify:CR=1 FL=1|jgi:hypothetical protein
MVARMVNKLTLIFLAVTVSLCGWIWFQHGTINDLRAENQTQANLIAEQEKVNQSLKDTIEVERQAVEQQRVINDEIKQATQDKVQVVRKIIKSQPCYNTRIYDDAIERLH